MISYTQKQWLDTKIKYITCSEQKLQFRPFYLILTGQSEMYENGPNIYPMPNTWNQDSSMFRTKVSNLAILTQFDWPKCPQMAIQVNLRCLTMVSMDFPCPKPLG